MSVDTSQAEIQGVWQVTQFRSDSGWLVGFLDNGAKVVGEPDITLVTGLEYRFFGKWQEHDRYGTQFKFTSLRQEKPHSQDGIVTYLRHRLKDLRIGFGRQSAIKVHRVFGSETIERLREDPIGALRAAGITEARVSDCGAQQIGELLEEDWKFADTKIELASMGLPAKAIDACIGFWAGTAADRIRENAFILLTVNVPGIGFRVADRIYLELGGEPESIDRQMWSAWHFLTNENDGHTWTSESQVREKVNDYIAGAEPCPHEAIEHGIKQERIQEAEYRRDCLVDTWLASYAMAEDERRISWDICRLQSPHDQPWPLLHGRGIERLFPHQKSEVKKACAERVGILTGGPGTGKTFAACELIRAMERYGTVKVCCPTGKAAARINDLMERKVATTIHSMLGPRSNGHGTGRWNFRYGPDEYVEADYVFVDESSMIDSSLMASMLSALAPGTRVLFIGDTGQLLPVGHGAPLRDMISSGIVPVGHLSEIHRNSGQIATSCAQIRQGRRFGRSDKYDHTPSTNLVVRHCSGTNGILDGLRLALQNIERLQDKAESRRDGELFWNPIEDVQVIVSRNSKTEVCREVINPMVQDWLNADGHRIPENPYRVGDKIICLRNGTYGGETIANGEIGYVLEVEPEWTKARFVAGSDDGSDRRVKISMREDKNEFDLAYAITGHKSQGSEWPVVIVLADPNGSRVAGRNWWYTSISRAKNLCLVYGDVSVIETQAATENLLRRRTMLVERLRSCFERLRNC